jgi:hypothetical protein
VEKHKLRNYANHQKQIKNKEIYFAHSRVRNHAPKFKYAVMDVIEFVIQVLASLKREHGPNQQKIHKTIWNRIFWKMDVTKRVEKYYHVDTSVY